MNFIERALRKKNKILLSIAMKKNNSKKKIIKHYNADSVCEFGKYKEIDELWNNWTYDNRENNSGDYFRLLFLILNISYVLEKSIKGDFAEVGVYRGNSSSVLSYYSSRKNRRMYCFDTFEGFDSRDVSGVDKDKKIMFKDTSLNRVKSIVGEDGVVYVKGRFPDSIKKCDIHDNKFAVVSLDCDLYEPIKSGLEFFWPKLSEGGVVFVHDYSSGYWDGCTKACDEFLNDNPEAVAVLMSDKSGTLIIKKPQRSKE